jgi:hypothetical protein
MASGYGIFLIFVISIFLLKVSYLSLLRAFPTTEQQLSERRAWKGIAYMLMPIALLSIVDSTGLTSYFYGLVSTAVVCYFYTAIIGLPVLVLLNRFRLTFIPLTIFVVFVVIEVLTYLISTASSQADTGLVKWKAIVIDNLIHCILLTIAFYKGAGIPFADKKISL